LKAKAKAWTIKAKAETLKDKAKAWTLKAKAEAKAGSSRPRPRTQKFAQASRILEHNF
jgi:hypothetical protein